VPISVDEALSSYGFVYTLANNIPELRGLLDQAVSGGWTPEKLTATIESSGWWNSHADTVRNLVTTQYTDPATYQQNLANARNLVSLRAGQMGYQLSDTQLTSLAYESLVGNPTFDADVLGNLITTRARGSFSRGEGGTYQGQAAQLSTHMTELANSYGVPISDQFVQSYLTQILGGVNTLDGFESIVRARAKAAFPQFASQIDAGMSVRDIADPYISTYAQTLEVPETQVTLADSYIRKALSQTGQDGQTQTSMPLWQFQRMLKDDPRYDRTQQAKDDAFSTLNKIGKDWGFVGASA
jgi:hypothetical protein